MEVFSRKKKGSIVVQWLALRPHTWDFLSGVCTFRPCQRALPPGATASPQFNNMQVSLCQSCDQLANSPEWLSLVEV